MSMPLLPNDNNTLPEMDNEETNANASTMEYSSSTRTTTTRTIAMGFYGILFLATTLVLSLTLSKEPLFPFRPEDLGWTYAWLVMTVFDYYGACLCFCGVVFSSEPSRIVGAAWCAGFLLLGSPVCCVWVLLRLRTVGNLRLAGVRPPALAVAAASRDA